MIIFIIFFFLLFFNHYTVKLFKGNARSSLQCPGTTCVVRRNRVQSTLHIGGICGIFLSYLFVFLFFFFSVSFVFPLILFLLSERFTENVFNSVTPRRRRSARAPCRNNYDGINSIRLRTILI